MGVLERKQFTAGGSGSNPNQDLRRIYDTLLGLDTGLRKLQSNQKSLTKRVADLGLGDDLHTLRKDYKNLVKRLDEVEGCTGGGRKKDDTVLVRSPTPNTDHEQQHDRGKGDRTKKDKKHPKKPKERE